MIKSSRFKKWMSLWVTLSLVIAPPVHAGQTEIEINPVLTKIDQFIESLNKTEHVMLISNDELLKILEKNNIHLFLTYGALKAEAVSSGPDNSLAKLKWSEARSQVRQQARTIVAEMFDQPIEDINLTLLSIMHRYLFDDAARGALVYLIDEIVAFRFSPEAIYRLEKEASWQKQYSNGSIYAILLAGVGALWGGKRAFSAKTWMTLKNALTKWGSRTINPSVKNLESSAVEAANHQSMTFDQLYEMLERSGLNSNAGILTAKAGALEVGKQSAGETLSRIGRMRFFAKFPNLLGPIGVKAMFYIAGVAVAGGATNVGLHKLAEKLYPENFKNSVIDFNDIRDNYYDSLAAVRLTCLSYDLLVRAKAATSGPLLPWIFEINRLNSEFELMKRLNPRFIDVTSLPEDVKLDQQTGDISFNRLAHGQPVTEKFNCPKLKVNPEAVIRFSLNQVAQDLNKMVEHLGEIQAKTPVVPGQ